MLDQLLLFAGVTGLLVITPGADMALVTRNVLLGGFRDGFRTTLGVMAGLCLWSFASVIGLTALFAASHHVYNVMRFAGAAYLIYLGVVTLYGAFAKQDKGKKGGLRAKGGPFLQGFITNVLNPKAMLLYVALMPQFIGKHDSVVVMTLLMAAINVVFGFIWLTSFSVLVARTRNTLNKPTVRLALDLITGLVLVVLGATLALQGR